MAVPCGTVQLSSVIPNLPQFEPSEKRPESLGQEATRRPRPIPRNTDVAMDGGTGRWCPAMNVQITSFL